MDTRGLGMVWCRAWRLPVVEDKVRLLPTDRRKLVKSEWHPVWCAQMALGWGRTVLRVYAVAQGEPCARSVRRPTERYAHVVTRTLAARLIA